MQVHSLESLSSQRWKTVIALAILILAALHLLYLGVIPPGLYSDEASIGYNAWTIAHYGVDQFGTAWPLFFRDFGDYKGPVATYLATPFVWLFGLSSATTRLPSALAAIAVIPVAADLAWRLSKSRTVTLIAAFSATLEPWLWVQSHTALEGNTEYVLAILVAIWCLVRAGNNWRWFLASGLALLICIFSYSPGRVTAGLILLAAWISFWDSSLRNRLVMAAPVVIGYAILAVYSQAHPGDLAHRLGIISVFRSGSLWQGGLEALGNYLGYWSPKFLLTTGDPILRHSTGVGGLLFLPTAFAAMVGLTWMVKNFREPYVKVVLFLMLLAPAAGAIVSLPSNVLRDDTQFPAIMVAAIVGWRELLPKLKERRLESALVTLTAAALVTTYLVDFFTVYPARSAAAFDAGEQNAIRLADNLRNGHLIFLSKDLEEPVEQAFFALTPNPTGGQEGTRAGLVWADQQAQLDHASSGDMLVLSPQDKVPSGSLLVATFTVAGVVGGSDETPLVLVYRR